MLLEKLESLDRSFKAREAFEDKFGSLHGSREWRSGW